MQGQTIITLIKETFKGWSEDKAPRLAAALSYYTVFSLPPLLIIVIAIAGLVFGRQAVQGQLVAQINGLVGQAGAEAIETMIAGVSTQGPGTGILATVLGVVILLFGAAGFFGQLQDALNTVWEVAPKPGRGIWGVIQDRFLSFTMVLGTGFLLLVSLVISTALAAFGQWLGSLFPEFNVLVQILNFLLSLAIITIMFALLFKILPDAKIAWDDVWIGAVTTALLFTIGKFILGFYLGRSNTFSTYGTAGSLVLILLWIYYSSQILLLGAEFTQTYARRFGSQIVPEENAIPLSEPDRAQEGRPTAPAPTIPAPALTHPSPARPANVRRWEPQGESPWYAVGVLGFILGAILGAIFGTREKQS